MELNTLIIQLQYCPYFFSINFFFDIQTTTLFLFFCIIFFYHGLVVVIQLSIKWLLDTLFIHTMVKFQF